MSRSRLSPALAVTPAWFWLALLTAAVLVTYANGLRGPFVFDDLAAIVQNPSIQHVWPLSAWADVLRPPSHGESVAGRPLVNITLAVNYAAGGLNVAGYHAWNLATHLACVLLVFAWLRRVLWQPSVVTLLAPFTPDDVAAAVALLWAVHPLQSEAVDYVSARTETTMALCYLLTLYAAWRALQSPERTGWQAVAISACALGMTAKESMVTAPLLVAAIDRAVVSDDWRQAWSGRRRLYIGLAATWCVLAALAAAMPRGHSAGYVDGLGAGFETGVWTWLLNQSVMISRYLRLVVWPSGLVFDYGYPRPVLLADVAMPFIALAAAAALTLAMFMRRPRLGILPLWFFVTLSPSSSLVPIVTEVGAERRMYLPVLALLLGLVLGVAAAFRRAAGTPGAVGGGDRQPRVVAAVVLVLAAGSLAMGTRARNAEYGSDIRLWETVVERWPSGRAHANLAEALYRDGRHDEALAHLRDAVRELPDAHYDLGAQLLVRRDYVGATAELQAFLAARPGHVKEVPARDLLGQALMLSGHLAEAAAEFRTITRTDPIYAVAFGRLGDVLMAQERFADAVSPLQAYAALTNTPNAWRNLGIALARAEHPADAVQAFSREVALAPADGDARRNLANALVDVRAFAEAERQAREAVRLKPQDAVVHDLLGLALAGQGRYQEAREHFAEALRVDPGYQDARVHLQEGVRRPRTN